jgi:hypothetical protein
MRLWTPSSRSAQRHAAATPRKASRHAPAPAAVRGVQPWRLRGLRLAEREDSNRRYALDAHHALTFDFSLTSFVRGFKRCDSSLPAPNRVPT